MACGFDKELIASLYDGEATAGERAAAERHLASCPECARDLASMKELSAALQPLTSATAPMSIAEGVLREIAPRPRAASRPWFGWAATAAAALLMAVGTVYLLDGDRSPAGGSPVAITEPPKGRVQAKTALEKSEEKWGREWAPAAELETRDDEAKKDLDDAGRQGQELKKQSVPVIRVVSSDVAAARAEVDAFLKERELTVAPGAPLLGRTSYVRERYLQLDLTEEEVGQLEKRLAALKGTVLSRGPLEVEAKRVAEEEAKRKQEGLALGAPKPEDKADRSRGAKGKAAASEPARTSRIVLVFEPAPTGK